MTLKEFRQKTKHLPDDTEIFTSEHDMPGHRDAYIQVIAKVGHGMTGPYPQKQPTQAHDVGAVWGIFLS